MHATVGQHRLDADELAARRPVAQHVHTARVRRDHAADRRDVARAEIDAVLPARVARLRLQSRQRHARLRGDLTGARVDRTDLVEAAEVEHELAVQRHRTADEPGVAALRHDGDARRVAERAAPPRPRRPFRAARPRRSHPRNRPVQSTTFAAIDVGIGAHVRRADRVAQRREQIGRNASSRRCYGRSPSSDGRSSRAKIESVAEQRSLRGRLLVAAPPLVDPNFDRTVVLMLEHGDDGGLGIVLNRRERDDARRRVPRMATSSSSPPDVVFAGGPVATDAVIALARRRHADVEGFVQILDDLGTIDLADDPLDLGASLAIAARVRGLRGLVAGPTRGRARHRARGSSSTLEPRRSVRRRARTAVARRAAAPARPARPLLELSRGRTSTDRRRNRDGLDHESRSARERTNSIRRPDVDEIAKNLLDLAGRAHTPATDNAPLLCHVIGRAWHGATLDECARVASSRASSAARRGVDRRVGGRDRRHDSCLARPRRPRPQRAPLVPAPRPRSRRGIRRRRRARVPRSRVGVRRRRQRVQAQRVRPRRSEGHGRRRSRSARRDGTDRTLELRRLRQRVRYRPGFHDRRLPARPPPPARPALLVRARRRRPPEPGVDAGRPRAVHRSRRTPAPARSPRSST